MDNEMTNQSQETTEDSGFDSLFEDSASDSPTTESTEKASPFMTVKYNGAEQGLSQEEAITYAQKGMNYDKIYGQLEQMRNDPTRRVFEEQASRAGLSLSEYANRLEQFQAESAKVKIANDFKRENPDVSDDIAMKYADAQYQNTVVQKQQEEAQRQAQIEADHQQQAYAQLQAFQNVYPDVDVRNLPTDVIDDINAGETLLSAYRAHENREMRETIAALRQNRANESVATGALGNNAKPAGSGDPFLDGLLG